MPSPFVSSTPDWWSRRRVGLLVQMSIDSVPSWAPVGRPADRYRLDHDGSATSAPLVETLAHHRDRWHHVASHDEFVDLLTFDAFDADEWSSLARDTGAGTLVVTARDRYGLCWFDAATTDPDGRDVLRCGPGYDVLARLATACERDDLIIGATYWTGATRDTAVAGAVVDRHLRSLVADYGIRRLGGGDEGSVRIERAATVAVDDPEVVVDDRLIDGVSAIRVYDDRPPRTPIDGHWEVRIPISAGRVFNRSERDDHLATPVELVSALTEVIAKGGHAVLTLGADARGCVPDPLADRCRAVGGWVRRHRDLVDRGQPWYRWGDGECRHLVLDDVLHVIDVGGRGRFATLDPTAGRVEQIETLDGARVGFVQDDLGVTLDRPPRKERRLPQVYRVRLGPAPEPPIRLFDAPIRRPVDLAPLVDTATRGAIVQLGDGVYLGPASIPSGVTVRGLGSDRTEIRMPSDDVLRLRSGARLEHCSVVATSTSTPSISVVGDASVVVGCSVDGSIEVSGSHVRLVSVTVRSIHGAGVDHLSILRSTIVDTGDGPAGISIEGGTGHLVDSCRIGTGSTGVRISRSIGVVVRGNRFRSRWTGIELVDTQDSAVLANSFERVVRAIDMSGGSTAEVAGNLVSAGDSGTVLRDGATDCVVAGNRWERTRVGLIAWGAGVVRHHDNDCIDLGDADGAVVTGP
ncbi:MAG: alpha-L-fucosidase [Ilumatobacteraceae bacterium]